MNLTIVLGPEAQARWHTAVVPEPDCHKFRTTLLYTVSSRPAGTQCGDPASLTKKLFIMGLGHCRFNLHPEGVELLQLLVTLEAVIL